jgi:GTP:adenosylcobinamide-phosphate guanylyltransferase
MAAAEGVAHKAFIEVAGRAMIARVIDALAAAPQINDITIAAPRAIREPLSALTAREISFVAADGTPATTISAALSALPAHKQLLVTACDHPLLSPAMVGEFLGRIDRALGVAAACVDRRTYAAAYPGARRTFIEFSDGAVSGANLFWFRAGAAEPLVAFWKNLESKRKNPAAMAAEIGVVTCMLYLSGQLSRSRAIAAIARRTGVKAALVPLSHAEAAIDVDKPEDLALVREIFAAKARTA